MMDFLHSLDAVTEARREPDDGEPQTPQEIAGHKVAMAVLDCWLASAELVKLNAESPHAFQFINRSEADLWSIKMRIDALIDEVRRANGDTILPVIPRFKKVANG